MTTNKKNRDILGVYPYMHVGAVNIRLGKANRPSMGPELTM